MLQFQKAPLFSGGILKNRKLIYIAIASIVLLVLFTLYFHSTKDFKSNQLSHSKELVQNIHLNQKKIIKSILELMANKNNNFDELNHSVELTSNNCISLQKDQFLTANTKSQVDSICNKIDRQSQLAESFKSLSSSYFISIRYLQHKSELINYNNLMGATLSSSDKNTNFLLNSAFSYTIFLDEVAFLILSDFVKSSNIDNKKESLENSLLKSHIRNILHSRVKLIELQNEIESLTPSLEIKGLEKLIKVKTEEYLENQKSMKIAFMLIGLISLITTVFATLKASRLAELLIFANADLDQKVVDRTIELEESKKLILKQQEEIFASERLNAFGEMAAGIAHEINTPLCSINLANSFVKKFLSTQDSKYKDRAVKMSDQIDSTVERISVIISSLRKVARNGVGDEKEIVTLKEVVDDSINICRERLKNSSIDLRIDIDDNALLKIQSVNISQVLINLINNSYHAVQELDDSWIKIQSENIGNKIRIMIIDCGTGISKENLEKIFTPFFTTKAVGVGTGLGLSISRRILKDHNTDLNYQTYNGNTCFYFDLDLCDLLEIQLEKPA